jgi:hypothetical protein
MPLSDRGYIRGEHPPNCSCVECVNKRLGIHKKNLKTTINNNVSNQPEVKIKANNQTLPTWLLACLFIFSFVIVGFALSVYFKFYILFWVLLGFSLIYSSEKWLKRLLGKNKLLGKLYKLVLNLSILALLGLLIWVGIKLFSKELSTNALVGSLIFIGVLVFCIWLWKVVSKNRWRWPSIKLTAFSLLVFLSIFSFAGVQPFKDYKDNAFSHVKSFFTSLSDTSDNNKESNGNNYAAVTSVLANIPPITSTTKPIITTSPIPNTTKSGIDSRTGEYKNYFLGLVKGPEGAIGGNGGYGGQFIVLINNKNAKNPTYAELLNFLRADDTDKYPYNYLVFRGSMYYGEAEDRIDFKRIKNIIDGVSSPDSPHVCADFAERLHNNAEMAGIRCAYVSLDMIGYTDPFNLGIASDAGHACNAFETTDKGIVYIDCTGDTDTDGPPYGDMIVKIAVGQEYNPDFLFPSGGWYLPAGIMGKVINIFITWDGEWRN